MWGGGGGGRGRERSEENCSLTKAAIIAEIYAMH